MSKEKKEKKTGTREWAVKNVNIAKGCSNNCRYCYAKKMGIRFGRATEENWAEMKINLEAVDRKYKKYDGWVMFPSSHDITPEILFESITTIRNLLEAGNKVLIVSKPNFYCIEDICDEFYDKRDQIMFRFTITSMDNELLKFWEPGAPSFKERMDAVLLAYNEDFRLSFSIEPFLDKDPLPLIRKLREFTKSGEIWLGKMNYIKKNNVAPEEKKYYEKIRENYSEENIKRIFFRINNEGLEIRWKDSLREIIKKNEKKWKSYSYLEVKLR